MRDPIEERDPEAQFASPEAKGIAAQVTMTAQITQGRSIVLQTYIDRDASPAEFNGLLDRLSRAIERQEAKEGIIIEMANLALEETTLLQAKNDFTQVEARSRESWERANKRGPWKLSETENAQKLQMTNTIQRFADAIVKRKAEVARLQAVIARED